MKELKDYTPEELEKELFRQKQEKLEEEAKSLPEKYLPYEETKTISNDESGKYKYKKFYVVHVDDGCEGHEYLVQVNSNTYLDIDRNLIADTVKHEYTTKAINGGWDENLIETTFHVELLGHYGMNMLVVDGTSLDKE